MYPVGRHLNLKKQHACVRDVCVCVRAYMRACMFVNIIARLFVDLCTCLCAYMCACSQGMLSDLAFLFWPGGPQWQEDGPWTIAVLHQHVVYAMYSVCIKCPVAR